MIKDATSRIDLVDGFKPGSSSIIANVHAKVVYVAPVVEPTSATFRVVFSIDNEALALPAGFEVWYPHN